MIPSGEFGYKKISKSELAEKSAVDWGGIRMAKDEPVGLYITLKICNFPDCKM